MSLMPYSENEPGETVVEIAAAFIVGVIVGLGFAEALGRLRDAWHASDEIAQQQLDVIELPQGAVEYRLLLRALWGSNNTSSYMDHPQLRRAVAKGHVEIRHGVPWLTESGTRFLTREKP